jgi:methyl-accepting chemotaxis protein WspA
VLTAASVLLPLAVVLFWMSFFQSRVNRLARADLQRFASLQVDQAARNGFGLAETANELLQQKLDTSLNISRVLLKAQGGVSLGKGTGVWHGFEVDGKTHDVNIPQLLIGTHPVAPNTSFQQESPLVDEISQMTGAAVSLFERVNEAGDMLCIATTVPKTTVDRRIGSYLPAMHGDGSPTESIAEVLRGNTYRGVAPAWLANRLVSAYLPLYDPGKKMVIGMLFLGDGADNVAPLIRSIENIRVGETGRVAIFAGRPGQGGHLIAGTEGSDANEMFGFLNDPSVAARLLLLPNGGILRDAARGSRSKLWSVLRYTPWDWYIVATGYNDEFQQNINSTTSSSRTLIWEIFAIGVAAGILAWSSSIYFGASLTKPLTALSASALRLAKGDTVSTREELDRLQRSRARRPNLFHFLDFRDETDTLIESVRAVGAGLASLLSQVQRSGIQVNSSATGIAASARQLEATVVQQAATSRQVSQTTSRIRGTASELLQTTDSVTEQMREAGDQAEEGKRNLQDMEEAMRSLVRSTRAISSRFANINDRAVRISSVVTTINKVADQTSMLALNAAIEAEKAGEYGRGFSVVAREIGRLAEQTGAATQSIESVVAEMQAAVAKGAAEMNLFDHNVGIRSEQVASIATQLGGIIEPVRLLIPKFDAVRQGVMVQSNSAEQIDEAIHQLTQAAEQTHEALGEFNLAAQQLHEAVSGLQNEVSQFHINRTPAGAPAKT